MKKNSINQKGLKITTGSRKFGLHSFNISHNELTLHGFLWLVGWVFSVGFFVCLFVFCLLFWGGGFDPGSLPDQEGSVGACQDINI